MSDSPNQKHDLVQVQGFCPMGCGAGTLALGTTGRVMCVADRCANPFATTLILGDEDNMHHVVQLTEQEFAMNHPLKERLDEQLFDCSLHLFLRTLPRAPQRPGLYRVIASEVTPKNWYYAEWERIGDVGAARAGGQVVDPGSGPGTGAAARSDAT